MLSCQSSESEQKSNEMKVIVNFYKKEFSHSVVLYCTVLYCTVLYCSNECSGAAQHTLLASQLTVQCGSDETMSEAFEIQFNSVKLN